jgi:transposase
VEGDPARAREARLPGLRSDHPAAGPSLGRAGPNLLAHVLFAKYGLHPAPAASSSSDVYKREGIDLDVSTLGQWEVPPRQS